MSKKGSWKLAFSTPDGFEVEVDFEDEKGFRAAAAALGRVCNFPFKLNTCLNAVVVEIAERGLGEVKP